MCVQWNSRVTEKRKKCCYLTAFQTQENFQTVTFLFRFIELDRSQTLFLDFEIRFAFSSINFSTKTIFHVSRVLNNFKEGQEGNRIRVSKDQKTKLCIFNRMRFFHKIITIFHRIYTTFVL